MSIALIIAALRKVPWWIFAALAAVALLYVWHRAEVREAYRDGRLAVQAEHRAAQQRQRDLERQATALLEQRRRQDLQAANERTQRIDDATRNLPDQKPSARQLARACVDLLRTGQAPPECEPYRPR